MTDTPSRRFLEALHLSITPTQRKPAIPCDDVVLRYEESAGKLPRIVPVTVVRRPLRKRLDDDGRQ